MEQSITLNEVHTQIGLFADYAQTKDSQIAQDIKSVMERLQKLGVDCWNPALDSDWMKNMYLGLPFWMAYETVFHGKGNYLTIMNLFRQARKTQFDTERNLYRSAYDVERAEAGSELMLRDSACMMTIFADVMSHMSIEIFEQYKELEGFLKETLKGILASSQMQSQIIACQADCSAAGKDALGSVMLAYAILTGCETLGALSAEHYQEMGENILRAIFGRVDLSEAASYISGRM